MAQQILDLSPLRAKFPALQERDDQGRPYVFFDGPGGTQVPLSVIDAMADYFKRANANHGGHFITSRRNDETIDQARNAMADFINAPSSREIVFGANMTTLTFTLSRALGRMLQPGDEVVVTHLDHDGNIAPWLALREKDITIKWANFDAEDCRLDLNHISSLITPKTKLVALGLASNAVGTINPIKPIAKMAHDVGAWLWVDAVHYAPHGPIDVQELDCDFLVCSAYKFFGPHLGVLWGRLELLDHLSAYKVRPANPAPPEKFETGTLNHEGLAGVIACIDYLATLGQDHDHHPVTKEFGDLSRYEGRRRDLKLAMNIIVAYERPLFAHLLAEIQRIQGVRVYGIADPQNTGERCPTLAFTKKGFTPKEIAAFLGNENIFVWNGNYYALEVTEALGVEETGGMVRVGLAHYNTREEVDRFLGTLKKLDKGKQVIESRLIET